MMYPAREGLRFDYREQEGQRVKDSASLSDTFPQLKSLAVDIGFYNAAGVTKNTQIKYTPNLEKAKSVFRIDCPNNGCIGGDFDLSDQLVKAVTARRTTVTAEMSCQGWQSKTTVDAVHCHNILRYTLNLAY